MSPLEWSIEEGCSKHDLSIHDFLEREKMPGPIQMGIRRKSFHQFLCIEGERNHSIVVLGKDRCVYGTAVASERQMRDQKMTYLHSLKLSPQVRKTRALWAGFKKLRSMVDHDSILTTSIFSNNRLALKTLCSSRAGLPRYHHQGWIKTFYYKARFLKNSSVEGAEIQDIPELIYFWSKQSQQTPLVKKADLLEGKGPFFSCPLKNILLLKKDKRIAGTLVIRNLSPYKTWVVHSYSRYMEVLKPWVNIFSAISSKPNLPPKGPLHENYMASWFFSENISQGKELLFAAQAKIPKQSQLVLSLYQSNPMLEAAKGVPHRSLNSEFFSLHWNNQTIQLKHPFIDTGVL